MILRVAFALALATSTVGAAPPQARLPAVLKPLGSPKDARWATGAMSLREADRLWRQLVDLPGYVPIIVDDVPQPPDDEAYDAFAERPPLSLAAARASLRAKRASLTAAHFGFAREHPKLYSAADARAIATQWTAWGREVATATISADDRKRAIELARDDASGLDPGGTPKTFYVIVFRSTVDDALANFGTGDSDDPDGRELAPLLALWRAAWDARPYLWDSYQWTFDVAHPPTKLAELRALAADVGLACPYDRSGSTTLALDETPGELMARLELRRWTCYWYEE